MRGIGLVFRQQVIEAVLRIFGERGRQFNSQPAEARGSNRDQQSRNSLSTFTQIYDAFVNQISSG